MSGVTEGHGRYPHWIINRFEGGYIDGVEDNAIPEPASRNCRSVISRTLGSLESRPGQKALNTAPLSAPVQGLYSYYYGANRRLMIAYAGHIGYWDFGTNAFVQIATGGNTSSTFLFETCVNYLVGMDGVGTPVKWDGTTFDMLANAPAKGKFPVLHKEKLFCVDSDDPSTIIWSNSFKPEEWPGVHYWDIKKGDGDVITALVKYLGELIIFKRRSTHSLKGTSLDDMSLQEMDSTVGCVGPRAVAQHGTYLYVVGEEGIYVFNGMKYNNLSSFFIPKLWNRVTREHLHKAAVTIWDEMVWVALPIDGSTTNNILLIYHLIDGGPQGAWWPWDGMNISCFTIFGSATDLTLYTGHSSLGHILEQGVDKYDDDLTTTHPFLQKPVGAYWESKKFDFEAPAAEKKTKRAFVEVSQDTSAVNPHLIISKDYQDYEELILERADTMIRQYRFVNRDRWRYMSFRVEEAVWTLDMVFTLNETLNSQTNSHKLSYVRESTAYTTEDADLVTAGTPVYEEVPYDPADPVVPASIDEPRGFMVRSILIPFKPKPKPKVRAGMGGMGI